MVEVVEIVLRVILLEHHQVVVRVVVPVDDEVAQVDDEVVLVDDEVIVEMESNKQQKNVKPILGYMFQELVMHE